MNYTLLVMVTYKSDNRAPAIGRMLREFAHDDLFVRVAVTDNSHDAGTIDLLRRELAGNEARSLLTVQPTNIGFAPAVNDMHRIASARWGPPQRVLLVNPDVDTTSSVVRELISRASATYSDGVGIYSPLLVDSEGRVDRGAARRFWNHRRLFAEVVGAPRLALLLGSPSRQYKIPAAGGQLSVDIASGGFMCIQSAVFKDGLDDSMPMYYEDQEICARARDLGLRVVVDTSLTALHAGGSSRKAVSRGMEDIRMMELAEAPLRSMLQTLHGSSKMSVRATVLVGAIFRLLLSVLDAPRRQRVVPGWFREQSMLSYWFIKWSLGKAPQFSRIR